MKNKGIFLKLTIVGGSSLLPKMQQLAKDFQVNELVTFTDRIPNNQLPELLKTCPIYIAVPVSEGVSSSLMEAMAVGVLPVVTDLPGNRPFIRPGINGEMVPVGNPSALAEKLEKVMLNYADYREGINKNRQWIEKYANHLDNMKYFYERYLQIIKQKSCVA